MGNVNGPATSTDEAVARWNGTTGKLLQDSSVTINSDGDILTAGDLGCAKITATGVTIPGVGILKCGNTNNDIAISSASKTFAGLSAVGASFISAQSTQAEMGFINAASGLSTSLPSFAFCHSRNYVGDLATRVGWAADFGYEFTTGNVFVRAVRLGYKGNVQSNYTHIFGSSKDDTHQEATLPIVGATQDTTLSDALPANARLHAIVWKWATDPDTGTNMDVGDDSGDTTRFATGLALTGQGVILVPAAEVVNVTAREIRITITGSVPSSGSLLLKAYYCEYKDLA